MKHDIFTRQYSEQGDLREKAFKFTTRLIADFDAGEITPDSGYVYANGRQRAERFMLAGNGPTAYAVFLLDGGTVESGFIEYTEHTTAVVALPDWIVEDLYAALNDT